MKYLVLLLLALVVLWRFRSKRQEPNAPRPNQQAETAPTTVEMQACRYCGLHMPFHDMVAGAHGRYCSAEHCTLAER